ncbi:hypothetical protein M404DRAFT_998143 [Pisolithus tinctorius Marx 270]|uniref:Uncharacterized protein n=1 Tax=Pisolithus tinctorius Marx 270 TaxID=870435 RepID=A0A0C3PHE8_PISTI|nr:hypothetical protein M404DRAFT_998143 [Pisolithus tinctorius Marx 270]
MEFTVCIPNCRQHAVDEGDSPTKTVLNSRTGGPPAGRITVTPKWKITAVESECGCPYLGAVDEPLDRGFRDLRRSSHYIRS